MRLYSLTGATTIEDPEFGHFAPDDQGAFDVPAELGDRLYKFPGWETEAQRPTRVLGDAMDQLREPAAAARALEERQREARERQRLASG